MKRKNMLLVVLLMAVGFAAVSTTLYINGQTKINANQDDFNVYYSDAHVNGKQDKSVITDNTHISFTTELSTLGEKYVLDYEVTNGSKNYDAELVMECTQGNEYLTVTNEFDDDSILKAKTIREGKLTLELIKSNTGDDVEVTIECTINANALERDSLGIENRSEITVEAVDSNNTNLKAKAYEITGSEETALLDSLVETGYVENVDDVDALIEVKSDDFEDFATTTFDVSSIASEGDTIVILHFNESTQEWEYVSEETVDANGEVTADFTSYSPVAFVVKKEDGTLEKINKTYDIGEVITLAGDSFYVISQTDTTVSMLSKYSLSSSYRQSSSYKTVRYDFSPNWEYTPGPKEIDIFKWSPDDIGKYVNEYVSFLRTQTGDLNITGNLITLKELKNLGCTNINADYSYNNNISTCEFSPHFNWLKTGYDWWTRSAISTSRQSAYRVLANGRLGHLHGNNYFGVRPVITVSKSLLSAYNK